MAQVADLGRKGDTGLSIEDQVGPNKENREGGNGDKQCYSGIVVGWGYRWETEESMMCPENDTNSHVAGTWYLQESNEGEGKNSNHHRP